MKEFFQENRNFLDFFGVREGPDTRPIPASAARLIPGGVFAMRYGDGTWRLIIAVGKGGRAVYTLPSTRNTLVSCFKLDTLSNEIVDIVLQNLYKNVRKASYSWITDRLKTVLGSQNYRTYDIKKMRSIFEISINALET